MKVVKYRNPYPISGFYAIVLRLLFVFLHLLVFFKIVSLDTLSIDAKNQNLLF